MTAPLVFANGQRHWRDSDGRLHRVGGPAAEYADGAKSWWLHGERHRIGGPAIEESDGYRAWYLDGRLLREDGPNGSGTWIRPSLRPAGGSKTMRTSPYVNDFEDRHWEDAAGLYHRRHGPACELFNGYKAWYRHGLRHRVGGPAVEWPDGTRFWFRNGVRGRRKEPRSP